MANPFRKAIEVTTEDAFYARVQESTPLDSEDATYEGSYRPLECKISAVLKALHVPDNAYEFFDDWVPNCTREVTIERRLLTIEMLSGLHGLLVAEYRPWLIHVIIVDKTRNDPRVGLIAMGSDWIVTWGCGGQYLQQGL